MIVAGAVCCFRQQQAHQADFGRRSAEAVKRPDP